MSRERLKEKLILNRLDKVYCRLKPSPIHGVGIFAIKLIPKGTNPFKDSYMAQDAILVNKNKISDIYKEMLNDYHPSSINSFGVVTESLTPENRRFSNELCELTENKEQIVSSHPNQLIWTNYLNYSDNANIELMTNGEWETLRDIQPGEELLEDPKRLFNKDGTQKSFIVRPGQYLDLV